MVVRSTQLVEYLTCRCSHHGFVPLPVGQEVLRLDQRVVLVAQETSSSQKLRAQQLYKIDVRSEIFFTNLV